MGLTRCAREGIARCRIRAINNFPHFHAFHGMNIWELLEGAAVQHTVHGAADPGIVQAAPQHHPAAPTHSLPVSTTWGACEGRLHEAAEGREPGRSPIARCEQNTAFAWELSTWEHVCHTGMHGRCCASTTGSRVKDRLTNCPVFACDGHSCPGEFVYRELMALIELHKYRAMKNRYQKQD